jgi:hypothetical protein
MSRSVTWTATCDIQSPDCIHTATMPGQNVLPAGWMNLAGALFGGDGGQAGNNLDVCPQCEADLAVLPPAWLAVIPTPPS